MIAIRTPLRVSFFGGGTDIESVYSQIGGSVFSTTIQKYIYTFVNDKYDTTGVIAKYSDLESVPHPRYLSHPIMRTALLKFNIDGVDISVSSDVPAGTGLGSSSSFSVGFINACGIMKGKLFTQLELAEIACDIEINDLSEPIGKQDAFAAAFGGLRGYIFKQDGTTEIVSSKFSAEEIKRLEDSLYLVRVGAIRKTSDLLNHQLSIIHDDLVLDSYRELKSISDHAHELDKFVVGEFGEMVKCSWELKKIINPTVTNTEVDEIISKGLSSGAVGAKLLGAGRSGFILFVVEDSKRFTSTLNSLKPEKVIFDLSGSQVLFNSRKEQ
jgi:D-glycero-alpha-D-manno-heptose-7-phosphate kinase